MKYSLFIKFVLAVLAFSAFPSTVFGAQCGDVFVQGQTGNVNPNLAAAGDTLDLSGGESSRQPLPSDVSALPSGDYVLESGTLSDYSLELEPGAQVRIFVDGSLSFGEAVKLNQSGSADQLLILVDGSFSTTSNSNSSKKSIEVNGFVYAAGSISIANNNDFVGSLAAGGAISTGNRPIVAPDEWIDEQRLTGLCELPGAGALPVVDDFESYSPGSIDGNDGGSNWGDSWNGESGQSIIDTSSDRLEFLASNGLSIRSDTTLEITGNNNRMATRPLSGSFDGEDIYLSMLVRFQGTPGNNDFLGFWLQTPDFGDSPQFGIKVNEGAGGTRDFFVRLDQNANYATEFEPGQTYLLVARFSKNSQDYYEQGRLWVNPQCTDSPPPTASASILSNPASKVREVSELGLRSANISGDARVQVGQVAAGEQWSDVVRCECFQNGLEATFYNNYDRRDPFPETPDLTRLDPTIDFNWGSGSPDPLIDSNQFAVQWQGTIEVPETGSYEFIARTDDGVRLWVDDLDDPLIDDWRDRAVAESRESITLQAGQRYGIRMQYYENGGQAEARLRWERPDGTEEIIPEEYLFGCLPVASPVLESASAICGSSDLVELTFVQSDRSRPLLESSLENTSFYNLESVGGGETFNVIDVSAGADGYSVVLQLDGDLNRDNSYRLNVADVQDVGGAVIDPNPSEFEFAAAGDGLTTEYWNNRNLAGAPDLTGRSDQILFDWGSGSPVPGTINADLFSVRWTGFIVPPETGNYVFRTRTDDGVRLYVNDLSAPIINQWVLQSPTNHDSGAVFLEAGRSYSFRMEMYENQGGAVAQLRWDTPGAGGFEVVPESVFFSCPDTGQVLDHFRISHGGLGVTCQPSLVSFEARDAAGDLLTDFEGQVSLSTSTGDGFWQDAGSSTGNLSIVPGDSGQASYQFAPADGGVATFALRHTQPATVNLGITDGDVSELPSADPDLVFQEAGFIFHRGSDFTQPIPAQISGRPSGAAPGAQDLRLTAVRESDTTGACEAFLVGEQSVTVGSVCESPGSCALDNALEVNGNPVASNSSGNTGNGTTVNMDFGDDSTSSAPLSVRYPDAGRISLFARAPLLDDQNNPTGEFISGSSGPFTVVPAGFCLEPVSPLFQCSSVDAECSVGAAAGEPFTMRLAAVNWTQDGETNAEFCDNPVTPNFAHSGLELTHQLLAPVSGDPGETLTQITDILPSGEGETQINQSVSEVGVFDFATSAGSPYFGETLPVTSSAPVGRFTPASFDVSLGDPGELGSACAGPPSFTYTGQAFDWLMVPEIDIIPLATDGTTTTGNYLIGAFNKLAVSGISRTDPERDQVTRLADDSDFVEFDYDSVSGVLSTDIAEQTIFYRYDNSERFEVIKSVNSRIEPFFPALAFEIDSVVDTDGISALSTSSPLLSFQPAAGEIRYGRLEMSNVYGPENADSLAMPFQVAFWDGSRFTLNAADSCTPWNKTVPSPLTNDETFHDLADEGDEGTISDGIGQPLTLEPKGTRGEERLVWDMPIWLQSDWSDDGSLENPSALATFGVHRGNDRVIYWEER